MNNYLRYITRRGILTSESGETQTTASALARHGGAGGDPREEGRTQAGAEARTNVLAYSSSLVVVVISGSHRGSEAYTGKQGHPTTCTLASS